MVGSRLGRATLGVAALASTQCSRPRTEVVVTVQSEIAWGVGRELQSLVVTVRRGGSDGVTRWQQTRPLGTEAGQWGLPLSFGLYPADASDATPVGVEVLGCAARDGCSAANALVAQRAVVSYRSEQTVGVDLWLVARCRGVACSASETCARETGQCVAAVSRDRDVYPIPGERLPAVDAAALVDATRDDALDGSTPDALTADADATALDATALDATATDTALPDVGRDAVVDGPVVPDVAADRAGVDTAVVDAAADDGPALDAAADRVEDAVPCAAPMTACGGACVDTMTDPRNCGACGRPCGPISDCYVGSCRAVYPGSLRETRWGHVAATLADGRVLVTGGFTATGTEVYDPVANRWSDGPNLPRGLGGAAIARLDDGRVYVFGGTDGKMTYGATYLLDLPGMSWRSAAAMPTGRNGAGAAVGRDGRVYVAAGQATGSTALLEVYDPATDRWSTAAPLGSARTYICLVTLPNGQIAAFGGTGGTIDLYDPVMNRWAAGPAFPARLAGSGCLLASDGMVHVVGGANRGVVGDPSVADHYVYDPRMGTVRTAAAAPTALAYVQLVEAPTGFLLAIGGRSGTGAVPVRNTRVFAYSLISDNWR